MGRYLMMQRLLCFLTTMYLIILSCPLALDEKKGHYKRKDIITLVIAHQHSAMTSVQTSTTKGLQE